MVLSNKKLKLKLRAELAQQKNQIGAEAPSSSHSLKTLLDSARLSKREKRRKLRSSQPFNQKRKINVEDHDVTNGLSHTSPKKQIHKKKKPRTLEDNGVEETSQSLSQATGLTQAKKKKKKTHKKKKPRTVEDNGVEETSQSLSQATGLTQADTTTSQDNYEVPTKVYVGGIPYYSTEDDIRSYFESCGTITEVDCMTFPETAKFRGIAIISFKTEAAVKRALALDGADMGGLFLKIQPYKATRANKASDFAPEILEGYNRIYVGNLSWDITEEELRKFFKNCEITSLRFGMDKETGEFRGYAHVDFSDSQSLKTALTLDQNVLFGRPIRISCAVPLKKKPGTHTSSVSTLNGADGDKSISPGSGKMKRRTCYECGEKGHVFSACPKKQTVAATPT